MQQYSIRARLSWAFSLFRLLVLVLGLFSIWRLAEVNAASAEIRDRWLQSTRLLGDINNYTSDYRAAEADHLLSPEITGMARAEKALADLERQIEASEVEYERLPHDDNERRQWRDFRRCWDNYRTAASAVITFSNSNRKQEGTALYLTGSRISYAAASDSLGVLTDRTVSFARAASNRAQMIFQQARVLIVLAILAAGLLTFALMRHIRLTISEPILALAECMRKLAANNTDIRPSGTERQDEVGEMARAVLVFRDNAIELAHSQQGLEQQASMLAERLEHEQRLTNLQRNFVSMASHEFRTPLTVIDGQAQRIIKTAAEADPGRLAERGAKIRSAVLRMTQLIEGLLTTERLFDGGGGLYFHPGTVDPAALLHEVCQVTREITPVARILERLQALPPSIPGDPKLLYQAFSNLLSNAVKYSPSGGLVQVTGSTAGTDAVIAVQDEGIGIPAADQERLFERYFRGSNVKGIVGTGIGLYLVRMVILLHGGSVRVDSSEGRGSRFEVRLPMATADAGRAQG